MRAEAEYPFGHVVLDGHTFAIDDIRLEGGVIVVEFAVHGPDAGLEGPVTVFGEDGLGVWQSTPIVVKPVPPGQCGQVKLTLRVAQIRAETPAC